MARRTTKGDQALGGLIVFGLIVGLPLYGIVKFGEAIGWHWFAVLIVASVGGLVWYRSNSAKVKQAQAEAEAQERARQATERHAVLMAKYSDEAIVDRIMRGIYWQGETAEQLLDSLGRPEDTDEKVLKTKRREIWKYYHQTGNRYGLRLTLENGVVVGWEEKM